MKIKNFILSVALFSCLALNAGKGATLLSEVTADQAWEKLMDGNKRYVEAALTHPNQTAARREELARTQKPFAVIVCCSDSRVPPEVVFDQGIGDLFVVRVAGNVVDDVGMGSIEYAAEHLGAPLVVVLGHERCGAVSAAVAGGEFHDHLKEIVAALRPAVEKAMSEQGDVLENAIRANIKMGVAQLQNSEPVLSKRVKEGKLKVVGARYDLDTGKVERL